MKHSRLHPLAFRLAAAVALTLSARAANITWVGNTSINWADLNWSGTNNPPIANDILIFGAAGTAGAILNNNLAANLQFNGITFNAGASAFTFNGNGITLGGNLLNNSTNLQTINLPIAMTTLRTVQTVAGGGNIQLGGVLSGAGGYAAAGVGTVTITGTNTFTGVEDIGNGAANVASTVVNVASLSDYGVPSSIGARTAAAETATGSGIGLHFRSGTLQYTGSTPQSTNREIRILNGTTGGTIDASGSDPSATLSFTHTGVNKNLFDTAGTRTLTLTGTNTGSNSFSIQLTDQGANFTSLQKAGAGTWRIANSDNSYRGETIFAGGILNLASVSDYGVNSSIGGRLLADENTTVTGVSLHFQGGTLQYTGSTPQSTNRNIRILNGNGGTIDASGSIPSATLSFTKTGTNINLFDTGGTRTLTLTGTNTGDNGFSIPLLNQAGNPTSLAKTGIGTWVLNGPDSNVNTGDTMVSDGTLKLAKIGARAVTGPLNIVDGTVVIGGTGGNQIDDAVVVSFNGSNSDAGILRLANNTETIGGLSSFGVGIVENESGSAGTGTLTVNTTTPQSFGGVLRDGDGVGTDGVLSLVKTGASTLTFSGTSTHTGPTLVNAGTLTITGSLGAGTLLTIANATVDGFGAIDSNVNVQNGGTLASNGTIGGNISLATGGTLSGAPLIAGLVNAASGSHISPAGGTLPGTLFISGLTLENGSLLDYELGASSDLVTVTVANGLTINGGAFNVFEPGGVSPLLTNGTYTLLDYNVSFTGAITDLSVANSQIGKFYTIANDTANSAITLTIIDTTISEWNGGAADTLWASAGNWSLGVPNAPGAVAKFGGIPTVPTSVNVTGGKTVGGILFDNLNSYTIIGGATDLPITLDNGFAAATIAVINGNHTIAAPIFLATSANATTADGTSLTLAGEITGAKTFIAAGLGTTILTGTNSFAATNVNGGTLQIGNNSPSGTLGTGDVTIAPGATLAFYRSNDLTVANNIFGADATVTKLGAGTLTLTGSNTFATTALGGFNINEGTVKLNSAGALASGVRLNFGGGTLDLNERNVTVGALSGAIGSITDESAAAGTTTLTVNQAIDSTYGGTINNGAGRILAVTKSGAATLTLTGGNTFTGPLNITNGAVIAAGDVDVPIVSNVNLGDGSNDVWLIAGAFGNQFGAGTEINFTNAAKNAKFQLRGFNQTVAGLNANLDSQTSLAIIQNDEANAPGYIGDPGAANLTIDTATDHVFTGLIRNQNGGALGLIKEGTGTQEIRNVLVGADNFSSITVNNGIFRINFNTNANGTNVLVAGTSILVNPGGTLALTGTTNIAGPISGTGPILVSGTGTVTPSGNNSAYSGTLTLDSGTLGIGSDTALGTGEVIINGGIFRASGAGRVVSNLVTANGSFTLGRLTSFANPLTLGADITITANNFDAPANNDSRFNGGITGPFGVTFAEGPQGIGTGALVIAAANDNASTTIVSGRVTVEAAGFLANGPLTMNGGILNLNNSLQDVTSLAGTGGTINLGAGNQLRTTQSATTTFSGVLAGAGGIDKDGSGKLTLTGANTFSGGTTIDGGTLTVNADNRLGAAAGAVLIENDATLQAGGALSLAARTVTLGPGGGTIDTNGNTVTLAAGSTITGTELTKVGAGKLAILGVQTYDTLTTEAGRTDLGSALGTGTSTINANATTNLGVSQSLAALNIGPGGVVTLGALPPAPLSDGEEIEVWNDSLNGETGSGLAGTDVQAVPEPASFTLLCLGAIGLLRRKRRTR